MNWLSIRQNQRNLYEHILRTDPRRITAQLVQYKPRGHRDIVRPRRRWEEDLETGQAVMTYLEVDGDEPTSNALVVLDYSSNTRPLVRLKKVGVNSVKLQVLLEQHTVSFR
jgi:hypothetical protein